MEKYEDVEFEVIRFLSEDVITDSDDDEVPDPVDP